MNSLFNGLRRKTSSVLGGGGGAHPAAPTATALLGNSSENFAPPALKVVAGMDKPGAVMPTHGRRTLGDITNEGARPRVPAGAKPTTTTIRAQPSALSQQQQQRTAVVTRQPTNLGNYAAPLQHMSVAGARVPLVHAPSALHRADVILNSLAAQQQQSLPQQSAAFIQEAQPMVTVTASVPLVQLDGLLPPEQFTEPMMVIDGGANNTEQAPEDIDAFDTEDPQFCTDYVTEIYQYLREKEVSDRVDPLYMGRLQPDLNEKMRGILIDWMVEVHLKFKLLTETLYLSVAIVDKFLQKRSVERRQLQLVGITAMLIATKFEEIYAIEISDFIYIADNAYTREELIKMEKAILVTIGFTLSSPSPLHFLRRFSKAAKNDSHTHTLAKYLIELCLPEYHLLNYLPSQMAAGAVYLARHMMRSPPCWTPTLTYYTKYSEEQARGYAREIQMVLQNPKNSLKAIRKKYTSPKLMEVGKIAPGDAL